MQGPSPVIIDQRVAQALQFQLLVAADTADVY